MSLLTYLYECGSESGCNGTDCLTLKAESFTVAVARSPIIIPIPFGYIVGIDLGTNSSVITLQGVIDYSIVELPVNNVSGFHVGNTIHGNSSWNTLTSPDRTLYDGTPTATITAVTPTSLMINNVNSFFVDGETVTGGSGVASVIRPYPSKQRLEMAIRYWASNHQLSLYARDTLYQGYFTNAEFDSIAGREDRFQFRLSFAEATQHLASASGRPPVCDSCDFLNIATNRCQSCNINGDGRVDILDYIDATNKNLSGVWSDEQFDVFKIAFFDCMF